MKALVCDFCKTAIPESNRKAMVYDISIMEAEDYIAKQPEERSLLFAADHVCADCTTAVKYELVNIMRIRHTLRKVTEKPKASRKRRPQK